MMYLGTVETKSGQKADWESSAQGGAKKYI